MNKYVLCENTLYGPCFYTFGSEKESLKSLEELIDVYGADAEGSFVAVATHKIVAKNEADPESTFLIERIKE